MTPVVPQANELLRVAATVRAVADGASSAALVAEAIGVGERNGHYYAQAAAYLGLVTDGPGYALTPAGARASGMSDSGLDEQVRRAAASCEYARVYTDAGLDELVTRIAVDSGLGPVTARRRAACIASWCEQAGVAGATD